ncbi:MAG: ATP-binding cassette domain-containing protein [Clostridia bacterium]|nr:ATP-binding cassette domain-containing protein [Clostridia bacterium]
MLEISNITKEYQLKDQSVLALNNVSICFRRSEFVSILGPSGCGKTTLLNIIGGLDRYTSGDILIDGVSTKEYKDKDWDNYRNHRVGFVFQSYNLIPHQTVLENVELALTLSGIKKKERRERAIKVLNQVGLGDKLKSKPNQLSGGQMQRVAIARALVNDPEIILADEPTGALDSKTSVQIMDLLKQVSKDRLVIMVTHNPELADAYSSRIIRLLDGELIEDTKPYTKKEADKEIVKNKKKQTTQITEFKKTEKKKSMSFFTALALSFKNLLTKKGRTIMISFAGSIGIIGIALILAVSAGMTNYINKMQSESLSSSPIAVSAIAMNMEEALNIMQNNTEQQQGKEDEIVVYDPANTLIQMGKFNYLGKYTNENGQQLSFVDFVNDYYSQNSKKEMLNELKVSYASTMHLLTETAPASYLAINNKVSFSAMTGSSSSLFYEELNNKEYVKSLYDVVAGEYPTESNQVALVIDNSGALSNLELASLGIMPQIDPETGKYIPVKYEDIVNKKQYKLVYHNGYYNSNGNPVADFEQAVNAEFYTNNYTALDSMYNDNANTKTLTITCILKQKPDASGDLFSNGIMYTSALAQEYRQNCQNSNVVNKIKSEYLDQNNNFIDATKEFTLPYILNVSELSAFGDAYKNMFTFSSPKQISDTLKNRFSITLTDDAVIDLYLQVYGASSVPTGVFCYCSTFDAKTDFLAMVDTWNNMAGTYDITVTDSAAMLTSMLGTLVDAVSYVLIAFAAISLVVSSIMIGIITYTSVIERTKEIGVLRSVGASKRDVSRVFNAETTIIGFTAGMLGVIVSVILTIPISMLLKSLTGIANLAVLNWLPALVLVTISVVLTFVAGLVPARIASKKDPVLALRSE